MESDGSSIDADEVDAILDLPTEESAGRPPGLPPVSDAEAEEALADEIALAVKAEMGDWEAAEEEYSDDFEEYDEAHDSEAVVEEESAAAAAVEERAEKEDGGIEEAGEARVDAVFEDEMSGERREDDASAGLPVLSKLAARRAARGERGLAAGDGGAREREQERLQRFQQLQKERRERQRERMRKQQQAAVLSSRSEKALPRPPPPPIPPMRRVDSSAARLERTGGGKVVWSLKKRRTCR
eukprot:PLAT211.2.p1 GENE.PLAT211.2~~PLAT211.2.p1  ORF type:complete len:241 (-),score=43.47 PLAT211.2:548-1270(-)